MNSPKMKNFSFFAAAFPGGEREPFAFKAFTVSTGWVRVSKDANKLFYQTLGLTPRSHPNQTNIPMEPGRRIYEKRSKSRWDGKL